ncbi:endonuclease/exonuclease/phosphatase family protein [Sulfitobacter maritimus]|uniref:endonuclease/exonuclease/phosphatase family protein n=1 Tax=Sulfitobacter maritimus TaxID=2741719 RepID=UPI001FEA6CE1|nr:endonuclease/exonuclease/phosphatase family protein [Sulfitobacter maritimus]
MLLAGWAQAEPLRIATFNTELSRKGPGLLLRDILRGNDPAVGSVVKAIRSVAPDIIVLQGVDYDLENRALNALADQLAVAGLSYPHRFAAPPNAGLQSGADLDGDGKQGRAGDAQGYGRFFGQGAMAVLSRHPFAHDKLQDFSTLLWKDLPGTLYPMNDGKPFAGAKAFATQRLSSNSHWSMLVQTPRFGPVTLLTYHATPPVFDGPEDRNGRRNHDETAFWLHHLEGRIGTPPDGPFVLLGDANLDIDRSEGRADALQSLLTDPKLQDPLPDTPTVKWESTGPMRVDYILPSQDWQIIDAGLHWPAGENTSRHALIWVDLTRR